MPHGCARLTRPLQGRPTPTSHTELVRLFALLDEWYARYDRLPKGGFTDLCELWSCHPRDMEHNLRLYNKSRQRGEYAPGKAREASARYRARHPRGAQPPVSPLWDSYAEMCQRSGLNDWLRAQRYLRVSAMPAKARRP